MADKQKISGPETFSNSKVFLKGIASSASNIKTVGDSTVVETTENRDDALVEIRRLQVFVTQTKKKLEQSKQDFKILENEVKKSLILVNRISNFSGAIAIIIGVALLAIVIPIGLDNLKYNSERDDKFNTKISDIKDSLSRTQQNYYTKVEIDAQQKNFKDCIWNNGLKYCLK